MPSTPGIGALLQRLPRDVEGHQHQLRAQRPHALDLRLRRRLDHDHRARHAGRARRIGDALARIARADRPHAALALGIRQHRHRVGRAAQLVGVDRLQVLQLQPDIGKAWPSSSRTSGVRRIVPAMRARASSISASVMGRTGSSVPGIRLFLAGFALCGECVICGMTKDDLSNWALANGWQMIAGHLSLTRPNRPADAIVRLVLKTTVVQLEIKKPAGKWEKITSAAYSKLEQDAETGLPIGWASTPSRDSRC